MSNAKPLPVWDREARTLTQEFMPDSPATYDSHPRRSLTNWFQSHPAYDWLVAAYQDTRLSARKIQPFIEKHNIDMSEFEPGPYKTYADFSNARFGLASGNFQQTPAAWERSLKRVTSPGTSCRHGRNFPSRVIPSTLRSSWGVSI